MKAIGYAVPILVLLLPIVTMPARADHAADVAHCAPIKDDQKRAACFALINPPGTAGSSGDIQAPPATAGGDCDFLGDATELADCVAKSKNAEGIVAPTLTPAAAAPPPKPKRVSADAVAKMADDAMHSTRRWRVDHDRSPITDTENVYLGVDSAEMIPGELEGSAPAMLVLQCRDNQTDVAIKMNGHWFYDDHEVISRIDKHPAVQQTWSQSTDNIAAFHPDPIAFIRQLLPAKKLVIQTAPVSSPSYTATFDLDGITDMIKPLRAACGW